jgi:DNA polymerase
LSLITLDFETYYSKDYSLTKLSTEQYINDPRFEVIGVAIKVDDGPCEFFSGDHGSLKKQLDIYNWTESALLAHNSLFDAAILSWRFDIHPAFIYDTYSMAKGLHGVGVKKSLKELASRYKVGEKGDEVLRTLGMRRADFSDPAMLAYANYCINDAEITYKLFIKMLDGFPEHELELINLTLKMFTEPVLKLDVGVLETRAGEITREKSELMQGLMDQLGCVTEEEVRVNLASGAKFSEILRKNNITPPTKISVATGQSIPALAKTDAGFIALQDHEDPLIQQLCAARLGVKSTLEESRIERFRGIAERNLGKLPIPLAYYAAHTGRWGGSDGVNLQNLPSRDARKRALKEAIVAPAGCVIINADSAQIEARILAWLAGQEDLVNQFASNQDVYSNFAKEIFQVSFVDKKQRHVGKTCVLGLGYGTGSQKLQRTLELGTPSVNLPLSQCIQIVRLYRQKNYKITSLWNQGNQVIITLLDWPTSGESFYFGEHKTIPVAPIGLALPNNLYINYHDLRMDNNGYVYSSSKGPVHIWGGVVTENVVQALARVVIGEQMTRIASQYRVVLTVHDSIVCVVPEQQAETAMGFIKQIMSTPPAWAPGLPLSCDVKSGKSYGEV